MLKFMLDTNICIFTIKNKPASVRERFNLNQGRMCISSVTLMELIYGAEKSQISLPRWRTVRRSVSALPPSGLTGCERAHRGFYGGREPNRRLPLSGHPGTAR